MLDESLLVLESSFLPLLF